MILRYVRFHIDEHDCQCCGRVIAKGTIELSDGRRYGPQCAARVRGIPRPPTREMKRIEEERKRLLRARDAWEWRANYHPETWTWIAKGYGGNVGWSYTDIYRTPEGAYRAVIQSDPNTFQVVYAADIQALGRDQTTDALLVAAGREDLDRIAEASGARIFWTTDRGAEWVFRHGWDS